MKETKAPSYQFYPDKWLADTRRLTWKAKGLYVDILQVIWMQFQDTCSIPDDPKFIASELGCTEQEWLDARADIMSEHRPLMEVKSNRLFSNGLWKEHEKQRLKRSRLADNGRKGGRPKKQLVSPPEPESKRLSNALESEKQMVPTEKAEKRLSSPTPSPTPVEDKNKNTLLPPQTAKPAESVRVPVIVQDTEEIYKRFPMLKALHAVPTLRGVNVEIWCRLVRNRHKFMDWPKAVQFAIDKAELQTDIKSPGAFLDKWFSVYEVEHMANCISREQQDKQRKTDLTAFVEYCREMPPEKVQEMQADMFRQYGQPFIDEAKRIMRNG